MAVKDELLVQLNEGLDPKHIEKRQGMSYVSHAYMVHNLNRLFGFDGWDIQQLSPVEIIHKASEESVNKRTGETYPKWTVICTASVRLTVRALGDCTFKDEVGTCGAIGASLVDVMNTAHCGAPTYAVKRAAHWFGNQFGSSLYDGDNPLHNGGEDKYAISKPLTKEEVDMVTQSFMHDVGKVKSKKAFDAVMAKYVSDLKRLPGEDRDRMRLLSVEKIEKLKSKGQENAKQI